MLCRMKEDGKVLKWCGKVNVSVTTFTQYFIQETCHAYLPDSKGDSEVYGKIAVKLVSQDISIDYIIRQVEISEDMPHPPGHTPSDQGTRRVSVFHYLRWPKHSSPRGTTALLELMEYINKTQMSSGNKPITVMCK